MSTRAARNDTLALAEGIVLDRESLLVLVDADVPLGALERALAREELTLRVEGAEPGGVRAGTSVGAWLAIGASGAPDPWNDPVDHLVAGLEAVLADGRVLEIRPAPRRAVGPDLTALAIGADGRFVRIVRAWLRVHPVASSPCATEAFRHEREPPPNAGERALLDAIDAALAVNPAAK